jgi:hypothetical protein
VITVIPNSISSLVNLEVLNLNSNAHALRARAAVCSHLRKENEIRELPDSLFQLKKLRVLFLSGSRAQRIPTQRLRARCSIDFWTENKIERIPGSFASLTSLEELLVNGSNPLSMPLRVRVYARWRVRMQIISLTRFRLRLVHFENWKFFGFSVSTLCALCAVRCAVCCVLCAVCCVAWCVVCGV